MPPDLLILVVEDDADQRARSVAVFARDGHRVLEASNGREALSLLEAGVEPDLMVLDLMMPELDGASLLEQLEARGLRQKIRVLVATGVTSPLVRRLVEAEGYVFKPFGDAELRAAAADAYLRPSCRSAS